MYTFIKMDAPSCCLFLFVLACTGSPVEELMQAETALQGAQAAGAEDFAPDAFQAAADAMADARSKNERKDFEGARLAALDAKAKADTARAHVDAGKEIIKAAVSAGLTALTEEWKGIGSAATAKTWEGMDREKMERLRHSVETMIEDVTYLRDAGDYAGALAGIINAPEKIVQISMMLEPKTE